MTRTLTYHDLRIIQVPDVTVLQTTIDSEELAAARRIFRSSDSVLIAGAGAGTVAGLLHLDPCPHKILCYEPNPTLFERAKKNIRLDDKPLDIVEAAIDWKAGSRHFSALPDWPASHLDPNGNVGVWCEAIDDVVETNHITAILLDVEGTEKEILPNMDFTPIRAMVVELHERYMPPIGYFTDAGFTNITVTLREPGNKAAILSMWR